MAVVGANKIGLELAEAFLERDLSVHVFHDGPRVLPTFGPVWDPVLGAAKVLDGKLAE